MNLPRLTKRLGVALMLTATLGMLGGWAPRKPWFGDPARKEYLDNLGSWTEEAIVYRGLQTALIMRATLLEPVFREVAANERRRLLAADADDHDAFVERMRRDGSEFYDIVFSASSSLPQGNHFGANDAGWKLSLYADDQRATLVDVHHVRRPTPLHQGLYTHINLWSELWIARFERNVARPNTVVLKAASGFGHTELEWSNLHPK